MVERYSTPQMKDIWTDENRFRYWLKVEKAVARAEEKLGIIPNGLSECLKGLEDVDHKRVSEIERETEHEVTAFLQTVWEAAPCSKEFLHYGLTSYDVVDNATSLRIIESLDLVEAEIKELCELLKELALKHKNTPVLGRTHGRGAEPITFGARVLSWYAEGLRVAADIKRARHISARGRISGTVGTFTVLPPGVEEEALKDLGLEPEPVATQVIPRDRHAVLVFTLALVGTWLERMALNIRISQLEGLDELFEPFKERQTGSSAMPQKRNPVLCERVCGLSRILKANVQVALENVALWFERDISHSSAERVMLPDSFNLAHYLLLKMKAIISGLRVEPENMKRILEGTGGTFYSQRLLLALIRKGMTREDAYRLVQTIAFKVKESGLPFEKIAKDEEKVTEKLSKKELEEIFSLELYLEKIDMLYKRMNL
ncbi:adenylosuccinate lyase [bacterium]|nr:adenylosuccinate lyase [bacterium]